LDGKLVGIVANDRNEILVSENLQTALTTYLQTGKIIRPQLGLQYWSLSSLQAGLKNLPRAGILVLATDKDTPAAIAGLKQNDLIYEVNNQSLDGKSFEQILNSTPSTGILIVKFIRGGKEGEATITLKPTL
jgi:S1-C subfamily serine protease